MIGIDTNVLVRYLLDDKSVQGKKANELIERAAQKNEEIWICNIVLIETVWVMESSYKTRRTELVGILNQLFSVKHFSWEDRENAIIALQDFSEYPKTDYADCFIGRVNESFGCKHTLTFDKACVRSLGYFKEC